MKGLFQLLKKGFRWAPVPAKGVLDVMATAAIDYPWFGVVEGDELQQGDIFEDCPIYFPQEDFPASGQLTMKWEERDLIVVSQSCDLAKDQKNIDQVSLCPLWRLSEFKSGHLLSKVENLEKVRKGQIPRYHMIASSNISGFEREIRIIDLQLVYSLPVSFLRAKATKEKHLRLLPPYREHLSQSFARVFMRVGLPIDIPKFTKN